MNFFSIECCANSFQSAINGQNGGANRIELCRNLELGGLTPSKEEIKKTLKILNIPVRILIRPRS
ncbi:MAG: copper homeostasis protein CutC, partial [Flavobacteriales bacterium]|nr:copper homeostasis protein CutC [Flavobacteriales bacterium]